MWQSKRKLVSTWILTPNLHSTKEATHQVESRCDSDALQERNPHTTRDTRQHIRICNWHKLTRNFRAVIPKKNKKTDCKTLRYQFKRWGGQWRSFERQIWISSAEAGFLEMPPLPTAAAAVAAPSAGQTLRVCLLLSHVTSEKPDSLQLAVGHTAVQRRTERQCDYWPSALLLLLYRACVQFYCSYLECTGLKMAVNEPFKGLNKQVYAWPLYSGSFGFTHSVIQTIKRHHLINTGEYFASHVPLLFMCHTHTWSGTPRVHPGNCFAAGPLMGNSGFHRW